MSQTEIDQLRSRVAAMEELLDVYERSVLEETAKLEKERKVTELQARELSKVNTELEQFSYVAAHDLQEPLRTLTSFAAFLREDVGEELSENAARDLHYITDAAKRMQKLIADLLALSRASRSAMKREAVCLDGCVDAALEALRIRVQETGACIERQHLPSVSGDSVLLTQLYQNLLGNALKFVDSTQPVVKLTAEKADGKWTLGVQDNGIGIDPDYADQVFAPFRRLNGVSEYEGSGIGLAICRKAVERHGGSIWVESEPGKGSHFKFSLPAEEL